MLLYESVKTLIFLFFIINCNAKSKVNPRVFKITDKGNSVVLENDNSSEYNPEELLKFVQNHADVEYNVKNILNERASKYPEGKHLIGKTRVLAKRIVPPGQISPDFEYDKKYETFFKPLVRLRKVKKMTQQKADIVYEDTSDESTSEDDESEQTNRMYKNDLNLQKVTPEENQLYQSIDERDRDFRMSIEELGARFLKDIQLMLHLLTPDNSKNIVRGRVYGIVQELEDIHAIVFDMLEKTTTLRQDDMQHDTNFHKQATEALKKRGPVSRPHFPSSNPLWNFWTYKRPLMYNDCPDEQVKIGNVCVTPPFPRKRRSGRRDIPYTSEDAPSVRF